MIVVADIGGTNARFACSDETGTISHAEVLQCADFPSMLSAFDAFSKCLNTTVKTLAISVACPVDQDHINFTNNAWSFSKLEVFEKAQLDRLLVVNDFTAQALAVKVLGPESFDLIQDGIEDPLAPIAVLGPGTGLGVGGLVTQSDWQRIPLSTEGGHVTIGAYDQAEWDILRLLSKKFDHVSAERVASGPGILFIYMALCELERVQYSYSQTSEVVVAASQGDPFAEKALHYFSAFLGTAAADCCLTLGAKGGCVLAGGVLPKLGKWFDADTFLERFAQKGRFRDYLKNIPVRLMHETNAGLYGAAQALDEPLLKRYGVERTSE
jgi:glucokinase